MYFALVMGYESNPPSHTSQVADLSPDLRKPCSLLVLRPALALARALQADSQALRVDSQELLRKVHLAATEWLLPVVQRPLEVS